MTEDVIIRNGTRGIFDYAFENGASLRSVAIPEGVKIISYYTFSHCTGLTSVSLPGTLGKIWSGAFSHCSSLTTIEIPDSVYLIITGAFSNCTALQTTTENGAIYLDGWVIGYDPNATSVVLRADTRGIASDALQSCDAITSIVIPDGMIQLPQFFGCSNLVSVVIPESVTSILGSAFQDCRALSEIYYLGTESDWNSIEINENNHNLFNATIYYYSETEPAEAGNYWRYVNGVATKWELL